MKIAPKLHPIPIICIIIFPVLPKLSTVNPIKKLPKKISKIAKNNFKFFSILLAQPQNQFDVLLELTCHLTDIGEE